MDALSILSYVHQRRRLRQGGHRRTLREGRSALAPNDLPWAPLDCWIGRGRRGIGGIA
jgi:hypothetical protein